MGRKLFSEGRFPCFEHALFGKRRIAGRDSDSGMGRAIIEIRQISPAQYLCRPPAF
jgi:hypothetical protein